MAERTPELNKDAFVCSICLDLLKEPVTIPCGHSYCMSCVNTHWNEESWKQSYSCPQCRQNFTHRPVLVKNTMLAFLMEGLKKTALPAAPADHIFAAHGDVGCDLCSGRKLKAVKSCLQCLVSYCKDHLQPHYDVTALKRHKLVEPTENLQDNICSEHDEVMKMFCRTDQQCICYLCSVDQHKGHDTVTAVEERTERQKELDNRRREILHQIDVREKDMFELQQKFQEDQDKILQDISELEGTLRKLDTLPHTDDHCQFLHNFMSLTKRDEDSDSPTISRAARELQDKTENVQYQDTAFSEQDRVILARREAMLAEWNLIHMEPLDFRIPVPLKELRQYACDVTLDPNTAHAFLALSAGNKKVTQVPRRQKYRKHQERFTHVSQVLSKEALPARCYVEVVLNFHGDIVIPLTLAVAYKDVPRKGNSAECRFGQNKHSWALTCDQNDVQFFYHNRLREEVWTYMCSGFKVGIYVDQEAGTLAFYGVDGPERIHEIKTTFTQPLYLGIGLEGELDSVKICKCK